MNAGLPSLLRLLAAWGVVAWAFIRQVEGDGELGPPAFLPWAALGVVLATDFPALGRLRVLVGVEWLKLRRSRIFQAGFLATAGVALLAALTHEKLPDETGWSVAAHSLGAASFAAEVFVLVLGATALSGESTGGTLKMILPHAYKRSDWVLAKSAVLVAAAVLLAVVGAGVALGHAAITEGLGDVTKEQEPLFGEETGTVVVFQTAEVMRAHLLEAIAVSLASLVATAFLGVLLSCVFNGVVASLCAAFLLFGVLQTAEFLLQVSRETLHRIYAWYPGRMRDLVQGLGRGLNERWDAALLPSGVLLSLTTAALCALLAVQSLSRRDLQS